MNTFNESIRRGIRFVKVRRIVRRDVSRKLAAVCAGLCLSLVTPLGSQAQQPTEPGWPQPMNNNRPYGTVILNQNELRMGNGAAVYRWDAEGWYGGNMNRVWFKTEGSVDTGNGTVDEAELQALYARPISAYFDVQAGIRHDIDPSPSRTWLTVGVEGLAPLYWDVGAYVFVSDGGHAAGRVEASYNLQLTQRLILQPQFEFNAYTTDEPLRGIGSGLADMDSGLRLRYEIRRQFAPYIGVTYERKFGRTADYARREGSSVHDVSFVAGIRAWY